MKRYYLDNCATTMVSPHVAEAMVKVLRDTGGNPSSIHHEGRQAARAVADARNVIANSVHARPSEIVFTSSGTEANNLAIRGIISREMRVHGRAHVVTSTVEHASVTTALDWEQRVHGDKLTITRISVDHLGALDLTELDSALAGGNVCLVSLLLVNNETGVVQDIEALKQRKLEHPVVPWHLDAVQAHTKLPLDVRLLPFEMMALSAHKIHGPKGIGALYVRGGTELDAQIFGGSQEKYRRAGTENVVGIVGFGAAVETAPAPDEIRDYLARLESAFHGELEAWGIVYTVNGPLPSGRCRIPGFLNISFAGMSSREDLQIALDLEGVSLSSTSACHSGVVEESHVLKGMGVSGDSLSGAVRLQFDFSHTIDDAKACGAIVSRVVDRILQAEPMA